MTPWDRIVEMLEAGVSPAEIAWFARCQAAEVQAAITASPRLSPRPGPVASRGSWSSAEDAIVDDMRVRRLDPREVQAVLREGGFVRPTRSVSLRMRKLADRAHALDAKRRRP